MEQHSRPSITCRAQHRPPSSPWSPPCDMIWPFPLPRPASYTPTISQPEPYTCRELVPFPVSWLWASLFPLFPGFLVTASRNLLIFALYPTPPTLLLQVSPSACLPGSMETLHLMKFFSGSTSSSRPASLWMGASCVYFFPPVSPARDRVCHKAGIH